eukprot:TRINITY_DN4137_c0_g1_i1.p3 TRINITY_DN4137_c0_g1~~TRINITY_DN4137_c0_g1_i1.p3  ORF type:complete len:111 (+),score=2.94 TRINITY_DN4137_c0_g1_i1:104-436(+)
MTLSKIYLAKEMNADIFVETTESSSVFEDIFIGEEFVYRFIVKGDEKTSDLINEPVFSCDARRDNVREEVLPREVSQSHRNSNDERQAEPQEPTTNPKEQCARRARHEGW